MVQMAKAKVNDISQSLNQPLTFLERSTGRKDFISDAQVITIFNQMLDKELMKMPLEYLEHGLRRRLNKIIERKKITKRVLENAGPNPPLGGIRVYGYIEKGRAGK